MTTYYANFITDGKCMKNPITDTNKQRLLRTIINIAKNNTLNGSIACFSVWHYVGMHCFSNDFSGRVNCTRTIYIEKD